MVHKALELKEKGGVDHPQLPGSSGNALLGHTMKELTVELLPPGLEEFPMLLLLQASAVIFSSFPLGIPSFVTNGIMGSCFLESPA